MIHQYERARDGYNTLSSKFPEIGLAHRITCPSLESFESDSKVGSLLLEPAPRETGCGPRQGVNLLIPRLRRYQVWN